MSESPASANELRSYPSLEKRFWVLTLLSSIGAYVCLVIAVDLIAKPLATTVAAGVLVGAIGTIGPALVAAGARLSYVPRAFLKILLRPDGLTFDRDGRLFEIPFASITGVALRSGPAFASRLRLRLVDGRPINLNLTIEGIERAVQAILAAKPELLATDQAAGFLRRLMSATHRAARAYDVPPQWLALFLTKYIGFPIAFGLLLPNLLKSILQHDFYLWHVMRYNPKHYFVYPGIFVLLLAAVAGIAFNTARETLITMRERRVGARDLAFESGTRLWFTTAYFVCGLVFYAGFFYVLTTP